MEIQDYFRINKSLSDSEQNALVEIKERFAAFLFIGDRLSYVTEALDVMHRAFAVDNKIFLKDIFLQFHSNIERTSPHKEKLFADFEAIKQIKINSLEEQIHLVNIYRAIVADLFDPYITLFVACFQFIEGDFVNFKTADLSNSERSKHEFVLKRQKGSKIFDGYDPLVRNAISHAGANGIKYEQDYILFKNIKRGRPPVVTWVKWTTEELMLKIIAMTSFIHGIDCAVNIFGIDVSSLFFDDSDLEWSFLWNALSKEDRKSIGDSDNEIFDKISRSSELELGEKLKYLSDIFFYQCGLRNMKVNTFAFSAELKMVRFEVTGKKIDVGNQEELQSRFFELFRYGIIAEPIYRFFADNFMITELGSQNSDLLRVICNASDLKKYGEEEAGLIDLLHDSKCFIGKDSVEVIVDWESVAHSEYETLDEVYPRKKRQLD